MKKIVLVLIFLLLVPAVVRAEGGYLEVTASPDRKISLAVAPPVSQGGGISNDISQNTTDALRFDLELSGLFTIVDTSQASGSSGIRPGDFDMTPWRALGVEYLIKSGYLLKGENALLELRLYDVATGRQLLAKRYSGKIKDARKMAHSFSDEILLLQTKEKGPFTSKIAFVSKKTGNKEIYLMDYDGYNVQRLTANGSINLNPDFSPNGREIIYTSYKRGNPDLYRRDLFSTAEARISAHPGINITGSWSPDGNRIALALSKDGNAEIYIISKDGKQMSRLTHNGAIETSPTWSPDGSRIAFLSDRLGKPQIFVMNADGSNPYRLTTSGNYNVSPSWSPKGDRILYCRQQAGGFQIHSIAPDGSNDIQLTSAGSNEHPRWSPDGRFITFSSTRDGTQAIYVMRADGSGQTKVSRSGSSDSHPDWSPRW
ncbi:MAG: Tol-Pal system beta propeller repeat protein TolB [Geobacteraceae bacterium]